MATVVGMGKEKIEHCGSLIESESDALVARMSRELPAEIAVGMETRLTFVSEGRIEMQTARLIKREGRLLTFAPIEAVISVRRRMEARIPACLEVAYQTEDGEFRQTRTENVSVNGLALREFRDAPLPERTVLRLTLPANHKAGRAVVAMAGVVNRRTLRDGEKVAGVLLLEMAEEDRAAFHQFLESQTQRRDALAA